MCGSHDTLCRATRTSGARDAANTRTAPLACTALGAGRRASPLPLWLPPFASMMRAILRGLTVRTAATQCCSTQVIRELADAQCDPNRRDAHGRTALMAAARGGCALGPGADVGGVSPVAEQMWAVVSPVPVQMRAG
jgi:hypothetical protein